MKRQMFAIIVVLTILTAVRSNAADNSSDSLLVVFWNVENFFDYIDQGTGDSDRDFSSMGSKHWTKRKFYHKCDLISKSMMWMGEKYAHMPDVIGFAEVENKGVLRKMISSTLLRKYDYQIVHFDSGDRRGIDVALLYRSSVFELSGVSLKVPEYEGEKLKTRDILLVKLIERNRCNVGDTLNFIVNHHPSKFGGAEKSEGKRNAAMRTLESICDSIAAISEAPVIAMGDFNDTPDSVPFGIIENTLVNKGKSLFDKGVGTIRYEGKWDMIDMFLVSPEVDNKTVMGVCRIPFLMTWEKKHPGEKPLRTYAGPRYLGGVSDHCPIILWYFGGNSYL